MGSPIPHKSGCLTGTLAVTAEAGSTKNGNEFTLYATSGPLLVRVIGVAASSIPLINVFDVAQTVLAAIET